MSRSVKAFALACPLVASLCALIWVGGGCWPGGGDANQPAGTTELVKQTLSGLAYVTFRPTAAGKQITVTVSSDVTASRTALWVLDPSGNRVIDITNPTSNITVGSFVSTSTGQHVAAPWNLGPACPPYSVLIVQGP
jgi:hypothetical protein